MQLNMFAIASWDILQPILTINYNKRSPLMTEVRYFHLYEVFSTLSNINNFAFSPQAIACIPEFNYATNSVVSNFGF